MNGVQASALSVSTCDSAEFLTLLLRHIYYPAHRIDIVSESKGKLMAKSQGLKCFTV
jgi:hypothetical protein